MQFLPISLKIVTTTICLKNLRSNSIHALDNNNAIGECYSDKKAINSNEKNQRYAVSALY